MHSCFKYSGTKTGIQRFKILTRAATMNQLVNQKKIYLFS